LRIQKPLRELSVSEILYQTFNLYGSRFTQFLLPFLVAGIVIGVINAIFQWYYLMPLAEKIQNMSLVTPTRETLAVLLSLLADLIVVTLFLSIVTWVINTIVHGVAVKFASDAVEKGHASLREGLSAALSRLGSLFGAGLVTGILIFLGLLLLIVPGILIAIMFSLVVPAIMIDRKGVFESLGRSQKLVSKRWGKTFVLLLLIGIIFLLVSSITSLIVSSVTSALTTPLEAASPVVSSLIMALVAPILPIATTLLYYSMVARETPSSQK